MPPRAPVVWTTVAVGSERFRRRLDERHRELTAQAKLRGREYRRARETGQDSDLRMRGDFLAALGRLAAFEDAVVHLSRCRYDVQLSATADDLSRDYFELWQLVARRGAEQRVLEETGSERFDRFATQLGRLEGLADALIVAGRNVRLFPLPPTPWMSL